MTVKTQSRAILELVLIATVFWGLWSLRFVGVDHAGVWALLVSCTLVVLTIIVRKENWRDFGIAWPRSVRWTMARAGEFIALIVAGAVVPVLILTMIGHPPPTSDVLLEQPDELVPFLIDILFGAWIVAGVSEEFFFRGFLIARFRTGFGGGRKSLWFAVIAQAIWFGAAHLSQGLSGILVIMFLSVLIGIFYLRRANGILLPLMLGHAIFDTLSLTGNYLAGLQ